MIRKTMDIEKGRHLAAPSRVSYDKKYGVEKWGVSWGSDHTEEDNLNINYNEVRF